MIHPCRAKNDVSGHAIWTRPVWTSVLSAAANCAKYCAENIAGEVSARTPPGERESRPSTSALSVLILVCSVPACSWMASRGLSCCRSRPRAVSIAPWVLVTAVVMFSSGSSCSTAACQAFHRCCSANHSFLRFPRVLTFSVTNLLTPARESPALLIAALSCGSRPARRPVAVCNARNCLAYSSTRALISAELLLHPRESHPVRTGSFEAGETAGHSSRQGDDLGKLRDPGRRCGCRSRGLRDQSPRRQQESEEHKSLEEALERDVHMLPPYRMSIASQICRCPSFSVPATHSVGWMARRTADVQAAKRARWKG